MTFGFSRDDTGVVRAGLPGQEVPARRSVPDLDQEGVGKLMRWRSSAAAKPVRTSRSDLRRARRRASRWSSAYRWAGLRLLLALPRADRSSRGGPGAADASEGTKAGTGHRAPGTGKTKAKAVAKPKTRAIAKPKTKAVAKKKTAPKVGRKAPKSKATPRKTAKAKPKARPRVPARSRRYEVITGREAGRGRNERAARRPPVVTCKGGEFSS